MCAWPHSPGLSDAPPDVREQVRQALAPETGVRTKVLDPTWKKAKFGFHHLLSVCELSYDDVLDNQNGGLERYIVFVESKHEKPNQYANTGTSIAI